MMNRFTTTDEKGNAMLPLRQEYGGFEITERLGGGVDSGFRYRDFEVRGDAIERFAAYERTGLEPKHITELLDYAKAMREGLKRYKGLEEQGRLIELPCRVGDTVYQLTNKRHAKGKGVAPRKVSAVCCWPDGYYVLAHQGRTYCQSTDLGKTWFLTREEAEAALNGERQETP